MLFCLIVFPDRKKHSSGNSGSVIYTSEALSKLWPFGFASIGDVTFECCVLFALYHEKKLLVILLSHIMRLLICLLVKSLRVCQNLIVCR